MALLTVLMKLKAVLIMLALAGWLTVSASLASLILLVAKLILPRGLFITVCRRVQAAYLAPFVYMIERHSNLVIRQTGDAIPPNESALILPNHLNQDWAPLYSLALRCQMLGGIRCVLKDMYKFIPGFGLSMMMSDFLFLRRKWDVDQRYLLSKLEAFRKDQLPLHLWIFPEGTRFTREKHEEGQVFAKARGLPDLKHCLQPRVKGFVAMTNGLQGICTHVYDVTLRYQGFPDDGELKGPGLLDLFSPNGDKHVFHIHVKRHLMSSLPKPDKELGQWCYTMFSHKDELLEHYETHQNFPGETHPVRKMGIADWLPGFVAFSIADFLVVASFLRRFC
jgi:1-acyl-sn-glycerol-3-phosphate acyltransferase